MPSHRGHAAYGQNEQIATYEITQTTPTAASTVPDMIVRLLVDTAARIASNGPTENLNLKIKNTKRAARGYRNFGHYRLRLLLNHGLIRDDHSPTRIRTHRPRIAA